MPQIACWINNDDELGLKIFNRKKAGLVFEIKIKISLFVPFNMKQVAVYIITSQFAPQQGTKQCHFGMMGMMCMMTK